MGLKYSPQLEDAFHSRKRPVWVNWRMDETYIKIKGQWYYFSGEEGANRVREAYGPNYDWQVALKNKYDPTNLFRLHQNITPKV